MSTFATIIEFYKFQKVTFYTIIINGEIASLGTQFIENNKKHKHMVILKTWIQNIGNKRGARSYLFRPERKANALPPPIEISHKSCSLRWYCLHLSESVVILFNGGEKTKNIRAAQDCPIVGPHFELANILSEAILKAYDQKVFSFNKSGRLVPENIIIQF